MSKVGDIVGEFEVKSGKIVIADPCYDREIVGKGKIAGEVKAKNGMWVAEACYSDEGQWGERVSHLVCYHKSHPINDLYSGRNASFEVAVDSGQAGIYDSFSFKNDEVVAHFTDEDRQYKEEAICKDEPWYSFCCDRTLSEESAGVIPFGCVSSTGFGDGLYSCSLVEKDDEVVRVVIYFIDDEEEENDPELCDGIKYDDEYDDDDDEDENEG